MIAWQRSNFSKESKCRKKRFHLQLNGEHLDIWWFVEIFPIECDTRAVRTGQEHFWKAISNGDLNDSYFFVPPSLRHRNDSFCYYCAIFVFRWRSNKLIVSFSTSTVPLAVVYPKPKNFIFKCFACFLSPISKYFQIFYEWKHQTWKYTW